MNRKARRAKASRDRAGSPPAKRTLRCPDCGALVVLDDATFSMRHPDPICGAFTEAMARAGMTPRIDPWAEYVRPDGSVVEKGKA